MKQECGAFNGSKMHDGGGEDKLKIGIFDVIFQVELFKGWKF